MNGTRIDHLLRLAHEIGLTHGTNAALFCLQNGYDVRPAPDLSGEWADGYTPARLAEDVGLNEDEEDLLWDLCDAYEEAFEEAVLIVAPESGVARQ